MLAPDKGAVWTGSIITKNQEKAQSEHMKSAFGARKHGNGSGFSSRPRVRGALIYEISPHNHVGRVRAQIYAGFNAVPMAASAIRIRFY